MLLKVDGPLDMHDHAAAAAEAFMDKPLAGAAPPRVCLPLVARVLNHIVHAKCQFDRPFLRDTAPEDPFEGTGGRKGPWYT